MPGYFYTTIKIREDATPIDNVIKFAWDDDDYIEVEEWHEYTEEELAEMAEGEHYVARQEFLDSVPTIIDEQDEAICDLYEQNVALEDRVDEAICDLYESFVLGKEE